jgi:DNA helicase-2/ATP-dependent DNA helicase PcrA
MKFVADLHIHSHFSRATSKDLDFEHLSKWAQLKGVHVVGTGDIAHPGWLEEMKQKLEPAEEGLFRLKEEFAKPIQREVPKPCQGTVRFMLAGEISNIYKKNDRVRKIHNVVFLPSFEAVEKFQTELEKIGNIRSDGRPILGLDSRDLLEIVLETDPQAHLIPAHIWTPWFALLGSKSGFDSVEECFDDLTPHIFAVETGLSSDPPMNWRLSILDKYTLVSNSDAHSPPKLGREANHFNTALSYPSIFEALKTGDPEKYYGTIEFFPEEGKYHYDGHRKCDISWDPKTTLQHAGICPKCGKPVTVGVMHRVEKLADRAEGEKPTHTHPFRSLIPLPEILAEIHNVGPNSKRVQNTYETLLAKLGSELFILQDIPIEETKKVVGDLFAEAIRRMRNGEIHVVAGYDGEYGIIKVFKDDEIKSFSGQLGFLASKNKQKSKTDQAPLENYKSEQSKIHSRISEQKESYHENSTQLKFDVTGEHETKISFLSDLNPKQQEAVITIEQPLIVLAGPGTGKTRTLTHRIAYLIAEKQISPQNILAITFTNKAAREMAYRLEKLLGTKTADQITMKTFHAFGATILRNDGGPIGIKPNFAICNDNDRKAILKQVSPNLNNKELNEYLEKISAAKSKLLTIDSHEINQVGVENEIYSAYEFALQKNNLLDFHDLILKPIQLFEQHPDILRQYQDHFRWISVDEYQDINFAQYRLLRLLTSADTNLCVIGDADQAIYGFRGADREYFLRFQEDYPIARIIQLNKNYRSIQAILNASTQVIAKSADRNSVEIWSELVSSTKLDIYQAPTDKAEAEYVVHQIEKMVGGTSYFSLDSGRVDEGDESAGRSFSDFAVLYRISAQSKLLIEAFQRSGIPFQSAGQIPFFEHQEIQEIISFLWLIHNPDSNYHRERIATQFTQTNLFLQELIESAPTHSVSNLIKNITKFMQENSKESWDDRKSELIKRLVSKAAPFENRLDEFLQTITLQKETDEFDPRADRVALMTLHASKGLEFPVVFIVGCEESLMPYRRKGKGFDLEEERRLFYVGMTRAQEKLVLTSAKKRFLFGKTLQNKTSQFVNDIENTLKEMKKMEYKKSMKEDGQLKLF